MTDKIHLNLDIVLFGGGIAGLYTLKLLDSLGYQCLLLDDSDLGSGQTMASQGIIHGGLKYALTGTLTSEADAIKEMPDRWRSLLSGDMQPNLSATQLVSDHFYMFSAGRMASKFATFFASKVVRGRIEKLPATEFPDVFQNPKFKGNVYKLNDFVVDTASLLANLRSGVEHRCIRISGEPTFERCPTTGNIQHIHVRAPQGQQLSIEARAIVFSAGKGNASLCQQAGIDSAPMQLRPLHMTLVKLNQPIALFAHCVGTSSKPRITVTTHTTNDEKSIWYLGGELAETGVERDGGQQIEAAQRELEHLFPWIDLSQAQWHSFFVDRAEPKQNSLTKPDCAYTHVDRNVIVSWPTKLTLAPDLGDQIVAHLKALAIAPDHGNAPATQTLPDASIAPPPWEISF